MPLPERLARINRRVTNPITRRFAGRLPGFAIVIHRGRRSGAVYHTPVNVFRVGADFLFALTYGAQTDWVKNVLARGGCDLTWRGKTYSLVDLRTVPKAEAWRLLPRPVRVILRLTNVTEFLMLSPEGAGSPARLTPAPAGPSTQADEVEEEERTDG